MPSTDTLENNESSSIPLSSVAPSTTTIETTILPNNNESDHEGNNTNGLNGNGLLIPNLEATTNNITSDNCSSPPTLNRRPSVFSCGSLHHTPPIKPPSLSELQPSLSNSSLNFLVPQSPTAAAETTTTTKPTETNTLTKQNTAPKSPATTPVEPFIIGVTGASASGKTTVCQKIIDGLGDTRCVLLSVDWFYRGLPKGTNPALYNFDHPSAFDFDALYETLLLMKSRKPVSVPTYNFALHKRDKNKTAELDVADVIIVEGILTFYDPHIRNMMHMKVFVYEDADICLSRRIQRDVQSRGRSVESILKQYITFVKPAYEEFILPTKRYADMIMPRGGENVVLIDMIIKHIALKIQQDDLRKLYPGLIIMADSFQIRGLHTIIRDRKTSRDDIVFYSNRLMRLLVEEALGLLPFKRKMIHTSFDQVYYGVGFIAGLAAVSLLPDGATMESSLRAVCNTVRIGKMFINEQTNQVTYENLPNDIGKRYVLVLAPVLNSGRSCEKAIARLVDVGCAEDHIILLTVVTAPQAVRRLCSKFAKLKLVVSAVDKGLDENGMVYPGLGDFSTRYFGTD